MAAEPPASPPLVPHQRQEIGDARRVHVRKGVVLTAEEVQELVGYPIVLEGGIAQGKTTMARALARLLRKYGIKTMCCPEPTDLEALAEFMKYQVKPPKDAPKDVKIKFRADRAAAAVRMQNSMMRKRTDVMRQAAEFSNDGIAIIDRGPFGDTTFMTSTYRKYKVSLADENSYIIDLLRRYLYIDYPKKTFLILRVDAPVTVTHARYLGRESATPGNKYPPEYMQGIEDAHDSCARTWGPYVVYDNSEVEYVRPMSPIEGEGNKKKHGHPDENAVLSVARELCKLAKELTDARLKKK